MVDDMYPLNVFLSISISMLKFKKEIKFYFATGESRVQM